MSRGPQRREAWPSVKNGVAESLAIAATYWLPANDPADSSRFWQICRFFAAEGREN
jgi:hypothetical protein